MRADSTRTRFVLNACPVRYDNLEVRVGLIPFLGREQLQELRAQYQTTHVVQRRDASIQVVAVASGAEDIGERFVNLPLVRAHSLVAVLVREALLNYFVELGRVVLAYDPLTIIGAGPSDDLLSQAVPHGLVPPPWLSVTRCIEAAVRVFRFEDRAPFVGLVMDVGVKNRILASCSELISTGMDIRGLYVRRDLPSRDGRLARRTELVGCVDRVENNTLFLSDCRDMPTVAGSEATLVGWKASMKRCFIHAFGEKGHLVEERLRSILAGVHGGPAKLSRVREVLGYLSRQSFELVPGIPFRIGEPLAQGRTKFFPQVHSAPKPTYVFDPTGARTDTWHDRGLRVLGPYDSKVFTPTRPHIGVVCQARYKGQVEQMLHCFLHGVPAPNPEKAPFAQGFIRKYALDNCSSEFFLADDASVQAYDRAIRALLRVHGQRQPGFHLALIQIEEQFHALSGELNPYLVTKAALLSQRIPSQEFEIETVSGVNQSQLGFTLNNMALACYAKLGGIPWLVQANPTIAHELVIGLGSASVGSGRLGERQRTVGITTVFTGDGRYHLSSLSEAVPAHEFSEALQNSLRETVDRVKNDFNWQSGEQIRLIFHAFKDFKDVEAEAVKAVVNELTGYEVEYAFVHVVNSHPFLVFDELQTGTLNRGGRESKGAFAPQRGKFFSLSNSEVLLVLTGAKEVKQASDGLPRPVLLKLHRLSTFTDTTYLARQVLTFASHSWRSFFPSPMPVTILYSEFVARLLTQLLAVDRSVVHALLSPIGRTRWFL